VEFPLIDPDYQCVGRAHWPETWFACVDRGGDTMRRLVDRYRGNLMIIAHGASRSALGWGLLPESPSWHPGVCALVELSEESPGRWVVTCSGDTSFLPADPVPSPD
jgi:broad specificity phosphatase PhoE